VVVAKHACNKFFQKFPNCLAFDSPNSSACICKAMATKPAKLSPKLRRSLTWQAATERLLRATHIAADEWPAHSALQDLKGIAGLALYRSCVRLRKAVALLPVGRHFDMPRTPPRNTTAPA